MHCCLVIFSYIYIYICMYLYLYIYIYIYIMWLPSSSSPQRLCGYVPAMYCQWQSYKRSVLFAFRALCVSWNNFCFNFLINVSIYYTHTHTHTHTHTRTHRHTHTHTRIYIYTHTNFKYDDLLWLLLGFPPYKYRATKYIILHISYIYIYTYNN